MELRKTYIKIYFFPQTHTHITNDWGARTHLQLQPAKYKNTIEKNTVDLQRLRMSMQ